MDHLPPPIDSEKHEVVYMYASSRRKVYHPQDFFSLPKEYDCDLVDLLEDGLREPWTHGDPNEFVQSWLFFSLLAQVTNTDIHIEKFRREKENLSTQELRTSIPQWKDREKETVEDSDTRSRRYVRASMALDAARRFVSKHCSHIRMDRDDLYSVGDEPDHPAWHTKSEDRLDAKLTLSLAILGETLELERPPVPSGSHGCLQFHNHSESQEGDWGYSKYCREQLKSHGWCPFEIRRLESTLASVIKLYYICKRDPPQPENKSKGRHSKCSFRSCIEEREPYEALHVDGCDGKCKKHTIPEDDLVEYIDQGLTPLVIRTNAGEIEWHGEDLRKENVKTFFALTHSWEDGILHAGRDARDKNDRHMLACQLSMFEKTCARILKKQTKEKTTPGIAQTIYLWADVLCFPRDTRAKSTAINQMRDVYSKAYTVLVWDRSLMNTKRTTDYLIENNMKIRMSNWARRLWTLQEAVVAKDLHIQFKNDTVSLKELEDARDEARNDITHEYHYIWKAGHPFSGSVWRLRQAEEESPIQRTWRAVQFRKVSEPTDETIVLANVLKLDVKELEDIKTLQQDPEIVAAKMMAKFLDMLDTEERLGIPSRIIFLPPPKLELDGYGWAPKTWLSDQTLSWPQNRPVVRTGSRMKYGLGVTFPGIVLHCPRSPMKSETFHIPVNQSLHKWFKISLDIGGQGRSLEDFWENQVCWEKSKGKPSIIMSVENPRERWEIGVLVQDKGLLTRGEVRWVKILCRVWIRLETNNNILKKLGDDFRNSEGMMMIGERITSQKWCIDGMVENDEAGE